jgi:hypothetical protein
LVAGIRRSDHEKALVAYVNRGERARAFVLHGPHVEVVHRDDVHVGQVVLEPILVFVPLHAPRMVFVRLPRNARKGLVDKKMKKHLHRSAKRGHGVTDLVDVFLLSVNAQSHLFNKR